MYRFTQGLGALAVVSTIVLLTAPARAEEPKKVESLNVALKENAPKLLEEVRKRGYKNVAVLKFLVADSEGTPRADVGTLGRSLSDRLEVALTISLPDDDKFGIIAGASDGVVASDNKRVDHNTEEGRKALFSIGAKYFHLAWKPTEEIKPEAFLTGVARFSKDHRTISVEVQLVERKALTTICKFTATSDARTLTDAGLSYATARGAKFEEALVKVDNTAPSSDDNAEKLRDKVKAAVAEWDAAPVQLEILYDGVPQKVGAETGEAYSSATVLRVPAPVNDKVMKVTFRLTSRTDERVGVVLRLNGRNTIFEQRGDPVSNYKWILEKKGQSITIKGFQKNNDEDQPFKVLSAAESQAAALNYGESAGLIDLIVFRGVPKPESAVVEGKNDPTLVALGIRGAMKLTGQPEASSLKTFKEQLERETVKEAADIGREGGIVTKGETSDKNPIKTVEFFPSPYPVSSSTIRYYSPK